MIVTGRPMDSLTYVRYQGSSAMTRDEALAYLAKLDAGYVGRHHEALRKR